MLAFAAGGIALDIDVIDGGRITSLRACGREWMAASHPRSGTGSFVAAGTGGWDEIAPTVSPCELPDGTVLLDHGDAWRKPWHLLRDDAEALVMEVDLDSVGVRLERTIRAAPSGGVRLGYLAYTASATPVPLLWCAHPLFDASGGAYVSAGGQLQQEYPIHSAIDWPAGMVSGHAIKAFASHVTTAAIVHPDGAFVRMTWDLPHVGFYWDGGEFSSLPVIAIEPTTGASDSALRVLDDLPAIAAGAPLRWHIDLECGMTFSTRSTTSPMSKGQSADGGAGGFGRGDPPRAGCVNTD